MSIIFTGNINSSVQQTALPIAAGGTGQTTAQNAINALLPSQTGNNGKVLTTDGTNVSWATSSGSSGVSSFNTRTGAVTLSQSDVTTALGYTPYNSTNPNGYTTNTGTVTSVGGTGTVSGLTLSGSVTSTGNLTLGGTLSLTSSNVTTGLGYTPVNKAGDTMTGALVLNADPTTALGAATKQYVDNLASGVTVHAACETATTAALASSVYDNGASGVGATLTASANGALGTIGGYSTLAVNSRILVKNQADQTQNGIYTVTSLGGAGSKWVLTRASDFDGAPTSEIAAGDLTYVQEGTLAGTQWVETALGTGTPGDYIIVGTDNIVFTQFSGPGTYTAGTGISISSNTISNTGVTSIVAGTNVTVSGSTGAVTVNATAPTSVANISGGSAGQVLYQSASGTTAKLAVGTDGYVLTLASGLPTWAAAGGVTLSNDTSTNATYYPTFATATSGGVSTLDVSSSKLTFNPSTGTLTATAMKVGTLSVGYLEVPQNSQAGAYTLVLGDSGKHIYATSGGFTWTIPANSSVAFPVGTAVTFVNQSTSNITIAITSDIMYLAGTSGTTGSRTLGQYGMATALKVASTTWIISGTSLT